MKLVLLKNSVFLGIVTITMMMALTSCGGGALAPLIDQEKAAKQIELAKSVNAEKYAYKEYTESGSDFDTGESLIDTSKKSPHNITAKLKYTSAFALANLAYNQSIHPFIEALINETQAMIEESDANKTTLKQANETNQMARSNLDKKKYAEAQKLTLLARELLENDNIPLEETPLSSPEVITDDSLEVVNQGETHMISRMVVKGDSLWKISKQEYGRGIQWPEIFQENRDIIKNPHLIYPKQKLKIKKDSE